ncbi:hypothetical protein D3C75_930990 [compost metagenome]
MFEQGAVLVFRCMAVRQTGQAFGPGQGRTLTGREVSGIFPDTQGLQAGLGFAGLARIIGVHVDAVGTAVDLRSAQADQLQQRGFQPGLAQGHFQADHCLVGLRRVFGPFDTIAHLCSPVSSASGGDGTTLAPLR